MTRRSWDCLFARLRYCAAIPRGPTTRPVSAGKVRGRDHGSFFRCQTAPRKYSYMLGGIVSSCSLAMCARTISEYEKRSPQMRQCPWSRAKMYGRHCFGSSLGSGILTEPVCAIPMPLVQGVHSRVSACQGEPTLKVRRASLSLCSMWRVASVRGNKSWLRLGSIASFDPYLNSKKCKDWR